MRLIHCSDLHLDSKMESNLSPRQAKERGSEIAATFARMVDWAGDNGVRGILLAGDLFDTGRVTKKTADFVVDTIRNAPGIEFYYLRGNHDEKDPLSARELPGNLRLFGENWVSHRLEDVTITGLELNRENWERCYGELKLDGEDTNIVLLHGQTATQAGEEMIALPRLRGKNIDYLALGHIHSYRADRLDDRGQWCYCGCLEGRGFDECGEKGFVLLEIREDGVEHIFVPFAIRSVEEVAVDISDCVTVTQIHRAMEAAAAGLRESSMVKFTLTGTYTPDTQKDLNTLTELMEGRFWFIKVKDESRFRLDPEAYQHDASLKGQFIRLVMASDKTEEEKGKIICAGLQALAGEEVDV